MKNAIDIIQKNIEHHENKLKEFKVLLKLFTEKETRIINGSAEPNINENTLSVKTKENGSNDTYRGHRTSAEAMEKKRSLILAFMGICPKKTTTKTNIRNYMFHVHEIDLTSDQVRTCMRLLEERGKIIRLCSGTYRLNDKENYTYGKKALLETIKKYPGGVSTHQMRAYLNENYSHEIPSATIDNIVSHALYAKDVMDKLFRVRKGVYAMKEI